MSFIFNWQAHKDFMESQVNVFVCDLTADDLSKQISPSSVDVVTMVFSVKFGNLCFWKTEKIVYPTYCANCFTILGSLTVSELEFTCSCNSFFPPSWLVKQVFVLSAVSPEKMPLVLQNIRKVLKVMISKCYSKTMKTCINISSMMTEFISNFPSAARWLCFAPRLCHRRPCSGYFTFVWLIWGNIIMLMWHKTMCSFNSLENCMSCIPASFDAVWRVSRNLFTERKG